MWQSRPDLSLVVPHSVPFLKKPHPCNTLFWANARCASLYTCLHWISTAKCQTMTTGCQDHPVKPYGSTPFRLVPIPNLTLCEWGLGEMGDTRRETHRENSGPCIMYSTWIPLWILARKTPSIHCSERNKKAVLSQRWPRNAPYIWVPWKFLGLPDYVHGHYSQYFHGFLFRSTLWMFLQNLKSVALPVAEIIGYPKNLVPGYAHAPFSGNFLIGFYSDRPCKYTRQIWSL